MTFGDRVVGAMKLDPNAFEDVERDPTAIGQSVGVIVLAAVAAGIGGIYYGGLTGIISILGWVISFLLICLIWVWQMAAMVIAVRQVLDYSSTGKAVIVVLIGFVVNFILTILLLAPILGMRMLMS